MFRTLTNVVKSAAAVAASPFAVVADVLTLPSSAYDNRAPFHRTESLLRAAGQCMTEATTPEPRNGSGITTEDE